MKAKFFTLGRTFTVKSIRPSTIFSFLALLISIINFSVQPGRAEFTPQAAVSKAFIYQGRLDNNGSPVSGTYDFKFTLYDAVSGGTLMGGPIEALGIGVERGVFTVELDFGNPYWEKAAFLQIEVRPAGSSTYTLLTPRQKVNPLPVASSMPGVYTDQDNRFVGINRTSSITWAEVFGITADTGLTYGGMYINVPTGRPFYGYAINDNPRGWTNWNPSNLDSWELYSWTSSSPLISANDTSIRQPITSNGLVKAAAVVNCAPTPSILRFFSHSSSSNFLLVVNRIGNSCVIDFGFNISQRYYTVTAVSSDLRFANCALYTSNSLICTRFSNTGAPENGEIIVLVY
jgi:hypothetical protein